jgi:hypothetical protein
MDARQALLVPLLLAHLDRALHDVGLLAHAERLLGANRRWCRRVS